MPQPPSAAHVRAPSAACRRSPKWRRWSEQRVGREEAEAGREEAETREEEGGGRDGGRRREEGGTGREEAEFTEAISRRAHREQSFCPAVGRRPAAGHIDRETLGFTSAVGM